MTNMTKRRDMEKEAKDIYNRKSTDILFS